MITDEIKKLLEDCHLDHIAIAVESLEASKQFYELLGLKFVHDELVEEQKVMTSFAYLDNRARVELLESTDPEGPIGKYVAKKGAGLHHLCFRVPDIQSKQKTMQEQGIKFIYEAPKPGADKCLINFIHPKSTGGVLIELSQKMNDKE